MNTSNKDTISNTFSRAFVSIFKRDTTIDRDNLRLEIYKLFNSAQFSIIEIDLNDTTFITSLRERFPQYTKQADQALLSADCTNESLDSLLLKSAELITQQILTDNKNKIILFIEEYEDEIMNNEFYMQEKSKYHDCLYTASLKSALQAFLNDHIINIIEKKSNILTLEQANDKIKNTGKMYIWNSNNNYFFTDMYSAPDNLSELPCDDNDDFFCLTESFPIEIAPRENFENGLIRNIEEYFTIHPNKKIML
jgi:hypothetical protein